MTRWYIALLAAYGVIIAKAYRDCQKIWRQARLLRAIMGR